jgi:hypothetical protein
VGQRRVESLGFRVESKILVSLSWVGAATGGEIRGD